MSWFKKKKENPTRVCMRCLHIVTDHKTIWTKGENHYFPIAHPSFICEDCFKYLVEEKGTKWATNKAIKITEKHLSQWRPK